MEANEKCCVVVCNSPLDEKYWDAQYKTNQLGWDLGEVSPPLKSYIDSIEDKTVQILIPGAGNAYEADYLLEKGFQNVTVIDIAPTLVKQLKEKYANSSEIKIVLGDFFQHEGAYDVIIEQTFFCALPPYLRQKYTWKMHQLLKKEGKLVGLLFNRTFEEGPPFGGNENEYQQLFRDSFHFVKFETCKNSAKPRMNSELFIEFQKNPAIKVNLYEFDGITCTGCMDTVSRKFSALDGVKNVSMSSDFHTVLIVSEEEIPLKKLENEIAYDGNYKISKIYRN